MPKFRRFLKFDLFAFLVLSFCFIKSASAQTPVSYPLHVGDYWEYSAGITREITKDTVISNGLTYAKIVSSIALHEISFQRYSNDSVYSYFNSNDELFYDFTASPGDSIATILIGTDTLDITVRWVGMANVLGRERRQWEFLRNIRHVFDDEEYIWITDSIGLTTYMNAHLFYTLQGAIINGDTLGIITTIGHDEPAVPSEFRLYQNYPNPFNASTQIRFSIPKSDFVSLKIYNVLGEEVAALLSEKIDPGEHSFGWDASDLPNCRQVILER